MRTNTLPIAYDFEDDNYIYGYFFLFNSSVKVRVDKVSNQIVYNLNDYARAFGYDNIHHLVREVPEYADCFLDNLNAGSVGELEQLNERGR